MQVGVHVTGTTLLAQRPKVGEPHPPVKVPPKPSDIARITPTAPRYNVRVNGKPSKLDRQREFEVELDRITQETKMLKQKLDADSAALARAFAIDPLPLPGITTSPAPEVDSIIDGKLVPAGSKIERTGRNRDLRLIDHADDVWEAHGPFWLGWLAVVVFAACAVVAIAGSAGPTLGIVGVLGLCWGVLPLWMLRGDMLDIGSIPVQANGA